MVACFKRHARRFSPVERAGVSYVDGGVVNDLPVDIARQIGADYVIAISGEELAALALIMAISILNPVSGCLDCLIFGLKPSLI